MKAIQLLELHQPVQWVDVDTPKPGNDEVIVQIRAAALNHRDVFIQQGLYPGIALPVTLGSDGAGVVTEVGEGVDSSWIGREVVINCAHNWGDNPDYYSLFFKILGMPDAGTFAEYVRVKAKYLHLKPAHLTFEQAAAIPLAGLTAWRALVTRSRFQAHRTDQPNRVLITGIGGGVALFALQFAVAGGAEVWVTSGSDEKIQKAIELGAKGGVNYKNPDWSKNLMAETGGGKIGYFNIIIDGAGGPGFARLIDAAAPGAYITIYGGTTGKIADVVPAKIFFKQVNIQGTTMGTEREFADMLDFISRNNLLPIVDQILSMADVEQALRRMEAGKQFGKLVLKA